MCFFHPKKEGGIMIRLYHILDQMYKRHERSFVQVYNGLIHVNDPINPNAAYTASDNLYFSEDASFLISQTDRFQDDRATVSIQIPIEQIIRSEKPELKRLKHYLQNMKQNESTFNQLYSAKVTVEEYKEQTNTNTATLFNRFEAGEITPEEFMEMEYEDYTIKEQTTAKTVTDTTFYHGDISFDISMTHKNQKDKPTITYNIPIDKLGLADSSTAAADYCLRRLAPYLDIYNEELFNRARPDEENGKFIIHHPTSKVMVRNSACFRMCPQRGYDYSGGGKNGSYTVMAKPADEPLPMQLCICLMIQVQLPRGDIRRAARILTQMLPDAITKFIKEFDTDGMLDAIRLFDKQQMIRQWLRNSEYCAFVANGSILPRSKGTELPLEDAIPFISPTDDEIEILGIKGMGIKKGVTVITGGGYSGKSTLLDAISAGIYDHILGDGRELCITDRTAMTVSAEDGRSIKNVNVAPFIKWLPGCQSTGSFSTDHASGSTSQAANIMEAMECGAALLLIDEDRSATNFMIRDAIMKTLIEKEPITPFTDRVNELFDKNGVSTILVIGGSGEYLSVADKVYMMDDYVLKDVTERSRSIAPRTTAVHAPEVTWRQERKLLPTGFTSFPSDSTSERLSISDLGFIIMGDEKINITGLHDIVSTEQIFALGYMLREMAKLQMPFPFAAKMGVDIDKFDIDTLIDELYDRILREGLDTVFSDFFHCDCRFFDLPRKCEVKAVINRMRKVDIVSKL